MVIKICTCCDKPADTCGFQKTLKDLGAERFGKPLIIEKEVPNV